MRIGTIAQHANVGSGRINDHSIWLHHDYTNTSNLTTVSSDLSSGSLRIHSCSDSGPHGMTGRAGFILTATGLGKAASYVTSSVGQNQLNHAISFRTANSQSDSHMQWTNAVEPLNMRNFTMVYVLDQIFPGNGEGAILTSFNHGDGTTDQTYLRLTGASGESGIIEHFEFGLDLYAIGFGGTFIQRFQVQCKHNDGTTNTLTTNYPNGVSWHYVVNAGEVNSAFNYITIVGKSDGTCDFYIRGVKVMSSSNFFPDETVKAGAVSHAFNNTVGGPKAATAKVYEYMVFDKALDTQELYDIDWYIANKYKHTKGRAFARQDERNICINDNAAAPGCTQSST